MAPDVIDLVSSSPPRRESQSLVPLPSSNKPPAKRPAAAVARTLQHISFLSDDFASSDNFDELLTAEKSSTQNLKAKRQRTLSDESHHTTQPSLGGREEPDGSSLPPLRKTTAAQPSVSIIDDPIEVTSSIEATLRPGRRLGAGAGAGAGALQSRHSVFHRASSVTDPFVSSPLPPTAKPNSSKKIAGTDLPSDPFLSSSPVKPTAKATPQANNGHSQGSKNNQASVAAWDPIPSSAPYSPAVPRSDTLRRTVSCSAAVITIESSDFSSSEDELPAIADFDLSQRAPYSIPYARGATSTAKRKPSNPTTKKSQEERSRDKRERDAVKEAEKARKRVQREQEKEEKQRQRDVAAAIAEVNKARTDKKVSTREMIVTLASSLESTVTVQLQTLLDGLEVQHETQEHAVNGLIKWRRRVNSRFDNNTGQWAPTPQRIEPEQHVLRVMTAEELVELAVGEKLEEHMTAIAHHCPTGKIILLLQGVTAWTRKNRNVRNRQFASGVRSQSEIAAPTAGRRRNNEAQQQYISEDVVEDALLKLQIEHEVLIHHTAIPLETAQWITTFTQHISTIPYKRQRDEATSTARFCMESGQVKTGDDTHDTYVRMLQEIFRVTAPIAYGIAAEFSSVTKLVEGLERGGSTTLADVHKSANRDGAHSDRTIGQAVSRRLYKVFTGRDETSTDV